MNNQHVNCLLCTLLGAGPGDRKWYDKILYTHDEFSVLPGLGAQTEGYLLIVPSTHVHSCAELSQDALGRLEHVMRDVSHVLNQAYGPCIFFEHGACGIRNLAGGCIDHVHVHAVPTRANVLEMAKRGLSFSTVDGLSALSEWAGKPYLAIQDQTGEMSVAIGNSLPGQYMRRIVAESVGRPDEWDYEIFPEYNQVKATIDRLGPLLESMQATGRENRDKLESSQANGPLVYVARAVDNRTSESVTKAGEMWRSRITEAGFRVVDPVVTPFPQLTIANEQTVNTQNFLRVESDLAWLRRCDALLIDMSLDDWSYVGCVCELVYAYMWHVPTIVMTGSSSIAERLWLQYHATKIVKTIDDAITELQELFSDAS